MHKRTMLSMLAVVTAMLIAAAAVPFFAANGVSAQEDGQDSAMPANERFGQAPWSEDMEALDQDALRQLFQELPDREPLFGALNDTDGNISGRYISFMADETNGTIQNYALNVSGNMVPVLNMVEIDGFQPEEMNVSGPLFTAASNDTVVFAHDNPMGTFHVASAEAATVNMSMPAGFNATMVDTVRENVMAWTVTGNGITAVLVVNNGTVQTNLGGSPGSAGYVNISLMENGSVVFRALPLAGGFPEENERFLMAQMANWTVEGEMAIITAANTAFWYTTEAGMMIPTLNVTKGAVYLNLTPMMNMTDDQPAPMPPAEGQESGEQDDDMMTQPVPPIAQAASNASAGMRPMWYVLAVDRNTVNPDNGTVQVTVNGFQLTMANSSSELAGNGSMFWMYEGANATKFVIPLPNATGPVSIVVMEGNVAETNTAAALGLGTITAAGAAIVGVVGVIGAVVYLRRKK